MSGLDFELRILLALDPKQYPPYIMSDTDMKIDPARASTLVSQLKSVSDRVAAAAKGRDVSQILKVFRSYSFATRSCSQC